MTLAHVVDSKDGPIFLRRGPFPSAETCGGGFHGCLESGLHLEAGLCGSCHRGTLSGGRHPLGACYDEWERGPYAQKSILCQDCHMVDIPTFKRTADCFVKPGRQEYRHYFSGVNYQLAYLAAKSAREEGDEELARSLTGQYQMAVERLKSAAELVLIPLYHDGKLARLKVRVKNIRAGHNLPAALSETRQMWLEMTVRDESGAVIGTSGATRDAGDWTGGRRSIQQAIPPRGYREVSYGMEVPAGVKKIGIEAKLCLYQADRGDVVGPLKSAGISRYLKRSYGHEAQMPLTLDMAVKQATLQTSLE